MEKEKIWINTARKFLTSSLEPVPHELNELDWKVALSENRDRKAHHISAFANESGGGFFVFGISPEGKFTGLEKAQITEIITQLSNIARDALEPPPKIDYFTDNVKGNNILFVYVPESSEKPVHIRKKGMEFSYIRSGGQTRKMSKQEIGQAVLSSSNLRFEELEAVSCQKNDVLTLLNHEKLFELLRIPLSDSGDYVIEQLVNNKMIYKNNGNISITNLGAIVAARDFRHFPAKDRYSVRVIKYKDTNRLEAEKEKEFYEGYGAGFQNIINYIVNQLPTSEIIKDAIRRDVPIYPDITIRELVANALIHRDFSLTMTHPMIEIFPDRMEIINPGSLIPSVKIERIIDTAPESRNELFAGTMRRMGICEERGSGIDKALFAIEVYGLPPINFINNSHTFKAILYAPRKFKDMSQAARRRASYQHCCLKYVCHEQMTNASFRKRLGLKSSQYQIAWDIIKKSIEQGLIKQGDESSKSRRYAYYLPFWA